MYGQTTTGIRNFDTVKTWTNWAGALTLVQSVIWIGLTITAIVAYTCNLYVTNDMTYGTYLKTIFFKVYFHGDCKMSPAYYQNFNSTVLEQVETVLDPTQLLIWDCVYLAVAVCWLIVSIMLLACVRKDNVKLTIGAINGWVFFTAAICCMDVALGVIFGVDYGRFQSKALEYNANDINAAYVDPHGPQLFAGGVAAISMMIISFKGFIMWFINCALVIYLVALGVQIAQDNDSTDTLFMPRKVSDNILTTRPPIRAYEEEKVEVRTYVNDGYLPETRSTAETIEVNEDAIVRAAHMSRDANLLDRRFRNLDAFQQYPAPNAQASRSGRQPQSPAQETIIVATAGFPVPDYSPQPNQSPNSILRPHHY